MEISDGSGLFLCGFRTDNGRAARSAIRPAKDLLLVERPIMAVCHDANAQSAGQFAPRLQTISDQPRGLSEIAAGLHAHAAQEWPALHRRSGPSGYGLMGRARQLQS